MKRVWKIVSFLLAVMVAAGCMVMCHAENRVEYTQDGIRYELDEEFQVAHVSGCEDGISGEIVIPGLLQVSGKNYYVRQIKAFAFQNQTGITGVTVEEGILQIYSKAFSGCKSVKTVFLPKSLKLCASDAFEGCNGKVYAYKSGNNLSSLALTTNIDFEFYDEELAPKSFFMQLWEAIVAFFAFIGSFLTGERSFF